MTLSCRLDVFSCCFFVHSYGCAHDCRIVVKKSVHRLLTQAKVKTVLPRSIAVAPGYDDPGAHEINEARI